jgi:putative Ig domain-containing protein
MQYSISNRSMNAITRTVAYSRFAMIAMVAACLALSACQGDVSPTSTSSPASSSSGQSTSVALSGAPKTTATAGTNYLYQPALTQGSGDVTFSITGLPSWATFDSNTGVLTGTPSTSNEGKTAAITITASNGSSSASVGPFTIQVNAPATATVSLAWNAPTQNADGTAISGLAGFHIYYGTTAGALSSTVTISNPGTTTAVINGLAHGTYYFSVVAYNNAGQDSKSSNMATTTI